MQAIISMVSMLPQLNKGSDVPFDALNTLGVAIKAIGSEGRHVGIIYKIDNNPTKMCDLAFHHWLRTDALDESYYWIQARINYPRMRAIAVGIHRLANRKDVKIQYSTFYDGHYFKGSNLDYTRNGAGEGLTCATFVMAVFRRFAVELFNVAEFPLRAGDEEFKKWVVDQIRQSWLGESGQSDKWSFCPAASKIAVEQERR